MKITSFLITLKVPSADNPFVSFKFPAVRTEPLAISLDERAPAHTHHMAVCACRSSRLLLEKLLVPKHTMSHIKWTFLLQHQQHHKVLSAKGTLFGGDEQSEPRRSPVISPLCLTSDSHGSRGRARWTRRCGLHSLRAPLIPVLREMCKVQKQGENLFECDYNLQK